MINLVLYCIVEHTKTVFSILDKLYGEGVIVPVHHEDPDAGNFAYHCEVSSFL